MILVGAYPNSFVPEQSDDSPLETLSNILEKVVPPEVGLHLLPFAPSSGDSGFAPDDWFTVRQDLGTWENIRKLALQRKLIVDCIYNHIGINHPYVRSFFDAPDTTSQLIFAFQNEADLECPSSPRGGPVLRSYNINNRRWQVWQTFSDSAVDIQLDNPKIQQEIDKHLDFLHEQDVWGVRLDGPAYYGKKLGNNPQRHQGDAYRLARLIADKALSRDLTVCAQLDCDSAGLDYFPPDLGYDIPIVDYSYSVHLAYALLSGRVDEFALHLRKTTGLSQPLIRCPRTHDGILLRSKNLDIDVSTALCHIGSTHGFTVRSIDGSPYELNCSFPYLCSFGIDPEAIRSRIELSLAVTGFLPGWCYLYLPFLFGYTPESDQSLISRPVEDPRLLNRLPIPISVRKAFLDSGECLSTYALLEWLTLLHNEEDFLPEAIQSLKPGLLSMKRNKARIQLLLNFNYDQSINVGGLAKGKWIEGRRSTQGTIEPLGFGFWHY